MRRPRGKDEAFKEEYVMKHKYHGEKVNVIGFFSAQGVGGIETFTDNMTGKKLKTLLSHCLLQTANQHCTNNERWYHLHNNDKKFHSGDVKKWCFDNGVTNLEFPSYLPDLNPIENIWAILKYKLNLMSYTTVNQLVAGINDAWKSIPTERVNRIVMSMSKRCQAVIANNGYKTKY